MDYPWNKTPRPDTLYRVVHPLCRGFYDPASGFRAASNVVYPRPQMATFIEAVYKHRFQKEFATPFISTFASLQEAEMWAVAAEDIFKSECFVVVIDATHPRMQNKMMWCVKDVQEELVSNQMHLIEDFRPGDTAGGLDSEWLVLHKIPGVAIKVLEGSQAIRKEYPWIRESNKTIFPLVPLGPEEPRSRTFQNTGNWEVLERCNCPQPYQCVHCRPRWAS